MLLVRGSFIIDCNSTLRNSFVAKLIYQMEKTKYGKNG